MTSTHPLYTNTLLLTSIPITTKNNKKKEEDKRGRKDTVLATEKGAWSFRIFLSLVHQHPAHQSKKEANKPDLPA